MVPAILLLLATLIAVGCLIYFAVQALKRWSSERRRIKELGRKDDFKKLVPVLLIAAVVGFLLGFVVTVIRTIL